MSLGLDQPAAKLALAAEVLQRSGSIELKACGTSMLPSIWPGDVLTLETITPDQAGVGDIVLVYRAGRFFVHRLLEKRQRDGVCEWITKGDSVPHVDPPASETQLLGRVVNVSDGHRSMKPSGRLSRVYSAIAFLACRSDRFRSVLLRLHWLSQRVSAPVQRILRNRRSMSVTAAVCSSGNPSQ